jgi:hypothetical protein
MTILSSLTAYPAAHPIITSLLVVAFSILLAMPLFRKRFDPKGKVRAAAPSPTHSATSLWLSPKPTTQLLSSTDALRSP